MKKGLMLQHQTMHREQQQYVDSIVMEIRNKVKKINAGDGI